MYNSILLTPGIRPLCPVSRMLLDAGSKRSSAKSCSYLSLSVYLIRWLKLSKAGASFYNDNGLGPWNHFGGTIWDSVLKRSPMAPV
eukprot:COSAG02_NODE_129_length_34796_cov_26.576015_26_plen_86_part_00